MYIKTNDLIPIPYQPGTYVLGNYSPTNSTFIEYLPKTGSYTTEENCILSGYAVMQYNSTQSSEAYLGLNLKRSGFSGRVAVEVRIDSVSSASKQKNTYLYVGSDNCGLFVPMNTIISLLSSTGTYSKTSKIGIYRLEN